MEAVKLNVTSVLKDLGYNTVAPEWYDRVEEWDSWYQGNVKEFHNYDVWNGQQMLECKRYSLGMAKKVCEDWANLLMNEKVKITLEGEAEQEFVDEVFTENNFEVNINELQEKGAARGTYAIIPRVVNGRINAAGALIDGGKIALDFVTAQNIYPLSWTGRKITECAFATEVRVEEKRYTYLTLHVIEEGKYVIRNKFYSSTDGGMNPVPASEVKGYEYVPEAVITGSDKPQFVIGRLNIANNIDDLNPMGIAVFANAIDTLKGVDIAYDSYVNEFVLGKKRVMVKPEATKLMNGENAFDPNDLAYYVLPEDMNDGTVITPIDMSLRTAEHTQGLQDQLNMLSAKCGFGERYYRFDQGNVSTATQIVSENSTLFRTIKKHEIILNDVLTELCRILLRMGNNYAGKHLDEDVEISIDFDDSIIIDKAQEEERVYRMLAAGLMGPVEARSLLMNEDEETAAKALPGMETMTTEGQDEVE